MVNAGETSVDLPPVSQDEFGDIAQALRQFRDQAERLRRIAYTDSLTGLGNRARLETSLREALEIARQNKTQVALVYIDLDNFRNVNDSLGHSAGDRYLCEAVERLQRFIPDEALLCRYGGDKFTVLLQNIPAWDGETLRTHLQGVAATILRGISEPFQLGADVLPMSVSIGMAIFPRDGESGEQLVSAADAAMYLAKRQAGTTRSSPAPTSPATPAGTWPPSPTSAAGWRTASSSRSTSRSSTWTPGSSSVRKRCCAGAIPSGAWWRQRSSSPRRRPPA
jgi:diguanylate cyclase (GGDEF)-like protein